MVTKNAVFMRSVAFRKRLYMYEKNGEYYLHCEEGNFPIDKKTVKLLEKNEFNIRKGGR